jgi:histidine ammonia-lyase
MLIRANTLARGFSGIRLETLDSYSNLSIAAFTRLSRKGSLGASGDLAPLAHMSLPLIGEGEAEYAANSARENALKKRVCRPSRSPPKKAWL